MQPWLRRWPLVVTGLIVGALIAVALWPEATVVDVGSARRGPLQVTIDEEGQTRVRERFVVSAPVAGRVERATLEPGDPIRRGQTVLARISAAAPILLDPRMQRELKAAVDAAQATVNLARADRDRLLTTSARAQTSLRRQQELAGAGAISRDELEAAQTALRLAEASVRGADFSVARAEYEQQLARARLTQPHSDGGTTVVLSPIDGVVLRRIRENESAVPAGEPLIEVGDPTALEIVSDLLSIDAVRITPGAKVLVEQWGGPGVEGRVRRVEPSGFTKVSALGVEEQRVNVRIDFADAAVVHRFGDGYRVEVRIVVWEHPDVLTVPVGALFRKQDQWAVFIVDGDRVRTQVAQVGERNETDAQILGGLSEGQIVVLHPPDTLAEGARITQRR